MSATSDNKKPEAPESQYDALEFEFVDLDTARGALDEPPAGVEYWRKVNTDWTTHRRPANATDRALTSSALEWLAALPGTVRPDVLGALYPRVVNALAARWPERTERTLYLDDLTQDKRGGRKGFPPAVVEEIRRLKVYADGPAFR